MTEDLRQRLRDELDSRDRPPMVGIAETAVRQGRARRRTRTILGGGAATLGVAAAVGLVLAGQALTARTGPVTHTAAQQTANPLSQPPVTAASQAVTPPTAAHARRVTPTRAAGTVPATGRGILELLKQQLPAGTVTSHYGDTPDNSRHVEEYIQTPQGEAMIRAEIAPSYGQRETCASLAGEGSCHVAANGDVVLVTSHPDNCIEPHSVSVQKPDGSTVQLDLSTCLNWNGVTNPAAPAALTVDQAETILTDPRWDYAMSPALVARGDVDFPALATFG